MAESKPLYQIALLSVVLAAGFVLIILACALPTPSNYLPLLDVLVFLIAPLPNVFSEKREFYDDFDGNSSGGDFAKWLTGTLVVTGSLLPIVLFHVGVLSVSGTVMCVVGGFLIYLSILTFVWFFAEPEDDF